MREVFQIRAQQLQELIDDPRQSVETVQQAIVVKRAIDKNLKLKVIKVPPEKGNAHEVGNKFNLPNANEV